MAASPPLESYELYVLKDGRWEIHARFDAKERMTAIREAKRLAQLSGAEGVKVVKGDLAPDQGKSREQTIFKLYRLEGSFKPAEADRGAGSRGDVPGADRAPRRRKGSGGKLVAGVLAALLAGGAGAGVLYALPELAERLPEPLGALPGEVLAGGAFAALFLLVLAAAALWPSGRRRKDRSRGSARAEAMIAAPIVTEVSSGPEEMPVPAPTIIVPPAPAPPAPPVRAERAPTPPQASSPEPPRPPSSPYSEKQVVVATRFVARILRDLDADIGHDSPYVARGVDLFMTGAVAGLAEARSLPAGEERKILREVLQLVGRRARQAQGFIDSIDSEMARYPRGADMVAAGRKAMEAFLGGTTDISANLGNALVAWREDDIAPPRSPVTFLFVDVAPFADAALMRDDVLVQNALSVRNRLFRTVLGEFGGTEIRQTLRGLMAAFPDTKRGVDAAVKMQAEAVAHNQANADLPVHLQTGLDCGDAGDDDRRVPDAAETAAWICRKAQRDQILVSVSVRDGAGDCGLPFKEAGMLARENLYDAIPLFEVLWKSPEFVKEPETTH